MDFFFPVCLCVILCTCMSNDYPMYESTLFSDLLFLIIRELFQKEKKREEERRERDRKCFSEIDLLLKILCSSTTCCHWRKVSTYKAPWSSSQMFSYSDLENKTKKILSSNEGFISLLCDHLIIYPECNLSSSEFFTY